MTEQRNEAKRPASTPTTSPALSIASAILAVIGLVLGYGFSWMVCVVLGIAAVLLGTTAHRKQAPMLALAKLGIALGVLGILASFVLVAIVTYQLLSLGLS